MIVMLYPAAAMSARYMHDDLRTETAAVRQLAVYTDRGLSTYLQAPLQISLKTMSTEHIQTPFRYRVMIVISLKIQCSLAETSTVYGLHTYHTAIKILYEIKNKTRDFLIIMSLLSYIR